MIPAAFRHAQSKYSRYTSSDVIMTDFGANANGKYVIVTGSNCGLGFETARSLAKHGAIVTIACRSKGSGDEAVSRIKAENSNAQVSHLSLDLASFASVRAFSAAYKESGQPLNYLINNAGVMACDKMYSSDGLEMQFGVNHVGHFLLTTELLDVLKRSGSAESPSRVVTLSSYASYLFAPYVGIRFDDLKGELSA